MRVLSFLVKMLYNEGVDCVGKGLKCPSGKEPYEKSAALSILRV